MGKGRLRVAPIVAIALGALLVVGVLTFAGPCGVHEDGTVSPCFGTSHILAAMGAIAAIGAAVSLAMKNTSAQIALDVVVGLLGVAIACTPGNFLALCMMATMRCHTIMRPFAIVMGIALLVAAIVDVVMVRRAQAGTSRRPVNR